MNPSRPIACGALALASALFTNVAAAAEPTDQPLTRAQVRQAAIDARKAGQLRVGEDPYYPYGPDTSVLKPVRSKAKKTKAPAATTQDATASK